jgi:hypothetical protein
MRSTLHRLGYVVVKTKGIGPRLFIGVTRYVREDGGYPCPLISDELFSNGDVDEAFNDLQKELERARREAKAALKRGVLSRV